jgi:hypothetical protein
MHKTEKRIRTVQTADESGCKDLNAFPDLFVFLRCKTSLSYTCLEGEENVCLRITQK